MSIGAFDHPLLGGVFAHAGIGALFSVEVELRTMIEVEIALARVEARLGIIPAGSAAAIEEKLASITVDPAALAEGTRASGVIVPPLVRTLREAVGSPHGDYIHWGATTQDIVDTALVLRVRDALAIVGSGLDSLIASLADNAERYAALPMAARTRSQIATPTTFGLRVAGWLAPLLRCRERLGELCPRLLAIQFGGAAGTLGVFGTRGLEVMEGLATELDLAMPSKPWHSERDSLVELANWLALVTGSLGKMANDLILMGRSESREARAGEGGGSSTMPQKANPVAAEALVSIARYNAGQVGTAHQALIHGEERDCSAWALEWMILPQMLVATGAALAHANGLSASLCPDPARMRDMLGDEAVAEAAAFALAAYMPLGEAQALVKRASRQDGPLIDRLVEIAGVPLNPDALRDPMATLGTAEKLAARVVARAHGMLSGQSG